MRCMAESATACSYCGKKRANLRRCSICKQTWYCGAECQKAAWKGHKATCQPPLPPEEVISKIGEAHSSEDWRGVLKWKGRMEELLAIMAHARNDFVCEFVLAAFQRAHSKLAILDRGHSIEVVKLGERRIELLGKLQRFRDQGDEMHTIGAIFLRDHNFKDAIRYFQKARDVGAAHGFFSIEGKACTGLGGVAIHEGRHEEGLELLRNALVAFGLEDDEESELSAMNYLIDALFTTDGFEEVDTLLPRFREAATASSRRRGGFLCHEELSCFF